MRVLPSSRRAVCLIVVVAFVAVTLAWQSAAADNNGIPWPRSGPALPCKSPGRVIAVSTSSVLSGFIGKQSDDTQPGRYACSRGHKLRYVDDDGNDGGYVLRGSVVSRYLNGCSSGRCFSSIMTTDLVSGKTLRFSAVAEETHEAVLVRPAAHGVVFWTTRPRNPEAAPPQTSELHRGAADGSQKIIDSAVGLDAKSLAIVGKRVYWTTDGQARTVSTDG